MISRLALVFLSSVIGFFCLQPTLAGSHHGEGETRYLRFKAEGRVAYGILAGDKVKELGGDLFGSWWKTEVTHNLKDVKILVPSVPSKVMALAGNYQSHIGDAKPPEHPEPFLKTPSSLLRHKGNIVQPNDHAPVHYEAEVVIVIGRRAKNVSKEAALDYVPGNHERQRHQRPRLAGRRDERCPVVAGQGSGHVQPLRSLYLVCL